jgi:hypothetical protein
LLPLFKTFSPFSLFRYSFLIPLVAPFP